MQHIDNLTGVRGFAALSVLLLHLRYRTLADEFGPFAFIFQNRGLGVWVFFILSGFILAYVHHKQFESRLEVGKVARYLWARLARIYPVHIFMLLMVAFVLPYFGQLGWTINDTWYSFWMNVLLLRAWGTVDALTFNQASWSISAEWAAYLVFPLLALVARKSSLAIYVVAAVVCIWASQELPIDGVKHGWYAISCILHFTLGFCAYKIGVNLSGGQVWRWAGILLGPLLVCLFWLYPHISGQFYYLFMAGTAALILSLFKAGPIFLYANPASMYLGKISYLLYMSHITVFTVPRMMFAHSKPLPLLWELGMTIGAAALLYHLVEAPAHKLLRGGISLPQFGSAKVRSTWRKEKAQRKLDALS